MGENEPTVNIKVEKINTQYKRTYIYGKVEAMLLPPSFGIAKGSYLTLLWDKAFNLDVNVGNSYKLYGPKIILSNKVGDTKHIMIIAKAVSEL